ncbi:MAG: cyclic nucleotide-binding domain-containing protein [Myxococcales bacterium]|nr:cyclic nucleotide-binding domain-containing protein [Myxococcales bacterium]
MRRKIERLRERRRSADALELARHLCKLEADSPDAWNLLGDLAREASQPDLALAARFEAARLGRVGAEEWLALAAEADEGGFDIDGREARFQAADRFAMSGLLDRALELLDVVLEGDPSHRGAAQVRRIVARRLGRDREDREDSVSRIGATRDESGQHTFDEVSNEEWTQTVGGWDAPIEEAGRRDPSEPRIVTPDLYIREAQFWPSVLDRRPLVFVGSVESIDLELIALAEQRTLANDEVLLEQAERAELLYVVDDGALRISRERAGEQELGLVPSGFFCGGLGALVGLPSSVRLAAMGETQVRVVERGAMKRDAVYAQKLARALRALYLETVADMCPLFSHDALDEHTMRTFEPGEALAEAGKTSPLRVLITGYAAVLGPDERHLGYLCPADLAGELDPSPVTVRAATRVAALEILTEELDKLAPAAREEVTLRREAAQYAAEALARR